MLFTEFLKIIWFILPAYIANATPVLIKGTHPVDFKKSFKKKRILGDGKTIEGAIGGTLIGFFVGLIQIQLNNSLTVLIPVNYTIVFLLSFGAIFGDMVGSFLKRRFEIKRGEPAPLLDQLDFLIFALIFISPFIQLTTIQILILIIFTPIIHWLSNLIAYYIGIKDFPW